MGRYIETYFLFFQIKRVPQKLALRGRAIVVIMNQLQLFCYMRIRKLQSYIISFDKNMIYITLNKNITKY